MSVIALGELSFHLVFPLSMPILFLIRKLITNQMVVQYDKLFYHPLILIFFMFIGEAFIGLVGLSPKVKSKIAREIARRFPSKEKTPNRKEITLIRPNRRDKRKSNYAFIFLITIFDLTTTAGRFITSTVYDKNLAIFEDEMIIAELFFVILFSYFILHYKLHRHHYTSILIFTLGLIVLLIPPIAMNSMKLSEVATNCSWYVLFYVFLALQEVLEKWLMQSRYVAEIRLITVEGLMGMGVCLILFSFLHSIPCTKDRTFCIETIENVSIIVTEFSENPIIYLYCVLYCLALAMINCWRILTIKYYSPAHRAISFELCFVVAWVLEIVNGKVAKYEGVIEGVGCVIIIASCLIYNEVIILNFWKLSLNTRKEIIERGIEEDNKCERSITHSSNSHTDGSEDGERSRENLLFRHSGSQIE